MPPRLVSDMTAAELEEYQEWLELMRPMPMTIVETEDVVYGACGRCGTKLVIMMDGTGPRHNYDDWPAYCPVCWQRAKRCEDDQ